MSDYGSRYSFKENPVGPTPISNTSEGIQDSRVKFNISTKEIIKSYKLMPMVSPFLLIPTRWNSELNMWDIATSDSWINASVDSNNYLNVHARIVDQLPGSLSANGNLKVDISEADADISIEKHEIYRVQKFYSDTPLGSYGTLDSPTLNFISYTNIQGWVYTDQSGTLDIQVSYDGTTWYTLESYSVSANTALKIDTSVVNKMYRIHYSNGSATQGVFVLIIYGAVM